jgi:hypothetical protein
LGWWRLALLPAEILLLTLRFACAGRNDPQAPATAWRVFRSATIRHCLADLPGFAS